MGTDFFKNFFAACFFMFGITSFSLANDHVKQVIFLNEGYNDFNTGQQLVPVTLSTYDLDTKSYYVFDTITGARFGTEVIIEGDFIYVAADVYLLKYDKYTLQRVAQQNVAGIRGIAAWKNKIVVTRGEINSLPSYFQVYDQSDLSFDYELMPSNGPAFSSQDIKIVDDRAYFVINNGFDWSNLKGSVGVVDLVNKQYMQEYDLGTDGVNPDNLMFDGSKLYTLNNKDFSGSSISTIDISTGTLVTANLANVSAGCGTSAFFIGNVWYQQYGAQKIHSFDPGAQAINDSADLQKIFYGMDVDPVNNWLYGTVTDFLSSGTAFVYDESLVLIDSFSVGVSAGDMAFDVRKTSGIFEQQQQVQIFPNPTRSTITVDPGNFGAGRLEIFNSNGKMISVRSAEMSKYEIDVANLSSGQYFIVATDAEGRKAKGAFIKQ